MMRRFPEFCEHSADRGPAWNPSPSGTRNSWRTEAVRREPSSLPVPFAAQCRDSRWRHYMKGISKRARFLQKSWMEFAKESASWKRTRRNWQKSPVPAKKLEGIHKRAPFLEKNPKELAKESCSWKKARRNSQKSAFLEERSNG